MSDIDTVAAGVEWAQPFLKENLMNKRIAATAFAFAIAAAAAVTVAPALAADVGVSIGISQPGAYGRVDIGRFPQPEVVVRQPVIVSRPVVGAAPAYLWVPPAQRQNWRRYCGQYGACGQPVYFVRDDWYGRHVRPYGPGGVHYRADGPDGRREWREDRRDERHDRRDDRRDERHDNRRDDRRDNRH